MDKSDFIKAAPAYYMLAVVLQVRDAKRHVSEMDLYNEYTDAEDAEGPEYCYIEKRALLRKAIDVLAANGAVEVIKDNFGPHLYKRGEGYDQYVDLLESDTDSPFYKARQTTNRANWLKRALTSVNKTYDELDVREGDIENPDAEWSPIPLDQSDPELQKTIAAVDKALIEVEGNNGYAAQHPEERNFVVSNLKLLVTTLKNAPSTSIAFVKAHGLAPLAKLTKVFGKAALGKIIDLAIAALLAYFGLK